MDLSDFKQKLPAKKALIGFDFGTKRLGVAISDLTLTIASSYTIIYRENKNKDFSQIKKFDKNG